MSEIMGNNYGVMSNVIQDKSIAGETQIEKLLLELFRSIGGSSCVLSKSMVSDSLSSENIILQVVINYVGANSNIIGVMGQSHSEVNITIG